jgi:hypothetical protein
MPTAEEEALLKRRAVDLVAAQQRRAPGIFNIAIPGECPRCHQEVAIWIRLDAVKISAALGTKKKPTVAT